MDGFKAIALKGRYFFTNVSVKEIYTKVIEINVRDILR